MDMAWIKGIPENSPLKRGTLIIGKPRQDMPSLNNSSNNQSGAHMTKKKPNSIPTHPEKEYLFHPRPLDEQQMFDLDNEHLTAKQRAEGISNLIRSSAKKKKT
jgi:hypothetical protein